MNDSSVPLTACVRVYLQFPDGSTMLYRDAWEMGTERFEAEMGARGGAPNYYLRGGMLPRVGASE